MKTEAEFWARIDKDGPVAIPALGACWIGPVTGSGYGNWNGISAHRYAWMVTNGPIEPGLLIRHLCGVPACVNPEHLKPGTAKENAIDRNVHGTGNSKNISDPALMNLKISRDMKHRANVIAARSGKSLTDWMRELVEREVQRVEEEQRMIAAGFVRSEVNGIRQWVKPAKKGQR